MAPGGASGCVLTVRSDVSQKLIQLDRAAAESGSG